ncbi:hypothetical protein GOP47_0030898 [Adiantum capillus-veneris]|nr:hypothetical protein GOP47_0030898 [Adiantum capillus-veneris]
MKPEYFPPREDIILVNEAPTEFYILVSGMVDLLVIRDGMEKVVDFAKAGDLVGEIGVVCFKPQPFTMRTRKLSHLMRIDRTKFINIINANVADGQIVGNNLFQHLRESSNGYICKIAAELESALASGVSGITMSPGFIASKGETQLLKLMLMKGMDPNTLDSSHQTPLHIAAANGFLECARLLLEYGADPNIADDENSVPLFKAINEHRKSLARLLWEHGAYLPVKAQGDYLCAAAERGDAEVLQSLLNYGADVNLGNLEGTTALHVAVEAGWTEAAKLLVSYGAKVEQCNHNGLTPVDVARQGGQKELVQLLENPPTVLMSSKPLPKRDSKTTADQRNEPRSAWPRNAGFKQLPTSKGSLPFCARITVHPYHPRGLESNINKSRKFLMPLPETWDTLLKNLNEKLGYLPAKVFDQDAAEIDIISVIRDGDIIYAAGEEELSKLRRPSSPQQIRQLKKDAKK